MDLGKITKLFNDKIEIDENKIVIEYYKVITQTNTTIKELPDAIDKMKIRLENLGYTVYKENEEYFYNGRTYTVQSNELLVGIKNRYEGENIK